MSLPNDPQAGYVAEQREPPFVSLEYLFALCEKNWEARAIIIHEWYEAKITSGELMTKEQAFAAHEQHRRAYNDLKARFDNAVAEHAAAMEAAAEVDRAGGDAPHGSAFGLAAWIRARGELMVRKTVKPQWNFENDPEGRWGTWECECFRRWDSNNSPDVGEFCNCGARIIE